MARKSDKDVGVQYRIDGNLKYKDIKIHGHFSIRQQFHSLPSGKHTKKLLNMAIEIVDFSHE